MALGSTQPLTEPGVFPGGKGGWCVRLTTLPPSCAVVMKSGNLNFLESSGPLQTCNGTALPLLSVIVDDVPSKIGNRWPLQKPLHSYVKCRRSRFEPGDVTPNCRRVTDTIQIITN